MKGSFLERACLPCLMLTAVIDRVFSACPSTEFQPFAESVFSIDEGFFFSDQPPSYYFVGPDGAITEDSDGVVVLMEPSEENGYKVEAVSKEAAEAVVVAPKVNCGQNETGAFLCTVSHAVGRQMQTSTLAPTPYTLSAATAAASPFRFTSQGVGILAIVAAMRGGDQPKWPAALTFALAVAVPTVVGQGETPNSGACPLQERSVVVTIFYNHTGTSISWPTAAPSPLPSPVPSPLPSPAMAAWDGDWSRHPPLSYADDPLSHPLYMSDWRKISVGYPGLGAADPSPFSATDAASPAFDALQLVSTAAAGVYANDFSLGSSYDAAAYIFNSQNPWQRLLAVEQDEAVNTHIHTWEIRAGGSATGGAAISSNTVLAAYSQQATGANRGCFEPDSADPERSPSCVASEAGEAEEGCRVGNVTKSFGECTTHPKRFQRRREWVGNTKYCNPKYFFCVATPKLLLTSKVERCKTINSNSSLAAEWTCVLFPSSMRVYHGSFKLDQFRDTNSVFRIKNFEHVEIDSITLDVLPHPILGQLEELDADQGIPHKEKLRRVMTDHVGLSSNINSLGPVHSSLESKLDNSGVRGFRDSVTGEIDWAAAWENFIGAFPMDRRVKAVAYPVWVESVSLFNMHDCALRFAAERTGVAVKEVQSLIFERNWLQGQSLGRIQGLGFPVADERVGFTNVYRAMSHDASFPLDKIFVMGSGLGLVNGVNDRAKANYGIDCCRASAADGFALANASCDRSAPRYAAGAIDQTDYSGCGGAQGGKCAKDMLSAFVVQNTIRDCTMGDFTDQKGLGGLLNYDGLVSLSIPGLIFSNEFANFAYSFAQPVAPFTTASGGTANSVQFACDTMLDVANRRPCDLDWQGKHTRIERNVMTRGIVKLEGHGEPGNSVTYANNLMTQVTIQDYHLKWQGFYLHNTLQSLGNATTMVKNYLLSEFKEHAGWHDEPSSIFKANLVRAHESLATFIYRKLLSPLGVIKLADNLLVGTVGNMQLGEVRAGAPVHTRQVFGRPSNPAANPPFPAGTPSKCSVSFQQDEWACLQRRDVPLDQLVAAFAPKTALGSAFQLQEPQGCLRMVYVAPDGETTSLLPEEVLLTMFSHDDDAPGVQGRSYEWAVSYEVRPNNDLCPDGGYEYRDSRLTKWATPLSDGSHTAQATGWEVACSFEAFYGTEALKAWTTFTPRFPCSALGIEGTHTSDLYNVDSALLGTLGDPYRASLEQHFNPFLEQGVEGMGAPALNRQCGDPFVSVPAAGAASVRQGLRTLLLANPSSSASVSVLGGVSAGLKSESVSRDFCGLYRGLNPTVGAFEAGSSCPEVFLL